MESSSDTLEESSSDQTDLSSEPSDASNQSDASSQSTCYTVFHIEACDTAGSYLVTGIRTVMGKLLFDLTVGPSAVAGIIATTKTSDLKQTLSKWYDLRLATLCAADVAANAEFILGEPSCSSTQ